MQLAKLTFPCRGVKTIHLNEVFAVCRLWWTAGRWHAGRRHAREAAKWVNITNIMEACKVVACKVEACKVEACRYVSVFLCIPDRNSALHVLAICSCTMPCLSLSAHSTCMQWKSCIFAITPMLQPGTHCICDVCSMLTCSSACPILPSAKHCAIHCRVDSMTGSKEA